MATGREWKDYPYIPGAGPDVLYRNVDGQFVPVIGLKLPGRVPMITADGMASEWRTPAIVATDLLGAPLTDDDGNPLTDDEGNPLYADFEFPAAGAGALGELSDVDDAITPTARRVVVGDGSQFIARLLEVADLPSGLALLTDIDAAIAALVGTAPGVLNTLGEISDAINDDANLYTTLVTLVATKQAASAILTALAGLSPAADKVPYFSGVSSMALADFPAFGRSVAALANAAALRVLAGLVIGTDVQASSANLTALAALTLIADRLPYANGSGTLALATFTAAARALLDDPDADTMIQTLAAVKLAGQLGGTSLVPDVRGIRETGGPTLLTVGAIADGQLAKRSGSSVVGTAAPPAIARLKLGATTYLTIPGVVLTGAGSLNFPLNVIYYKPFTVTAACNLDSLVCEIATVAAAGKKGRMAVYAADADWQPLALIVQTTEFAVDALAVITKGSLGASLPVSRYLTAFQSDGSPNLRYALGGVVGSPVHPSVGTTPLIYQWTKAQAYATFADPGVAADTPGQTGSGGFYHVFLGISQP